MTPYTINFSEFAPPSPVGRRASFQQLVAEYEDHLRGKDLLSALSAHLDQISEHSFHWLGFSLVRKVQTRGVWKDTYRQSDSFLFLSFVMQSVDRLFREHSFLTNNSIAFNIWPIFCKAHDVLCRTQASYEETIRHLSAMQMGSALLLKEYCPASAYAENRLAWLSKDEVGWRTYLPADPCEVGLAFEQRIARAIRNLDFTITAIGTRNGDIRS